MKATIDDAKAVFLASLPTGPSGALIPGHTTWDMLGPQGKDRYFRMAQAALDSLNARTLNNSIRHAITPTPPVAVIRETDLHNAVCLCGHLLGKHRATWFCDDCRTEDGVWPCDQFRIDHVKTHPDVVDRVGPWMDRTRYTWPFERLWPDGETPDSPFVPGRR